MSQPANNKIDVVYTLDRSFVDFAAVSIVSLLRSQQADCHLHFIHDGDLAGDQSRLAKLVQGHGGKSWFHRVPASFPRDLPVDKHASLANYYRLAITRILPPEICRVVYLDGDTLIRRSLDALFAIDLGPSGLGAVSEPCESLERLGLPTGSAYLNSGVLAIDLETWRDNDTTSQLLQTAQANQQWVFWDQDVLAVYFRGNWTRLPPEYNVNHRFFFGSHRLPLPSDEPIIVHFSGNGIKPWQSRKPHPYGDEFWKLADSLQQEGFSIPKPRQRWYKSLRFGRRRKARRRERRLALQQQRKAAREQWDQQFIAQHCPHLVVARGPFQGIRYPEAFSHGSTLVPKLLGTYEAELHDCFRRLAEKDYRLIIDVGAAEGYYAVGAARLWNDANIVAYELVESARQAIASMAVLNGVADRIEIQAECLYGDLRSQRGLIICDIEGAEQSLLVRDGAADDLAKSDLIIEAHDFLADGVSDRLIEQFSRSHRIQVIESLEDGERPSRWPVDEIEGLSPSQRTAALAERRPEVMRWIICESLRPFPQRRISRAA